MDKATAMRRIKKAMALSQSSNEHEAQRALAQAQKLMAQYDVSQADVDMIEIKVSDPLDPDTMTVVGWQSRLAARISQVFAVKVWRTRQQALPAPGRVRRSRQTMILKFFGPEHRVTMAEHSFHVLKRQIEKARREYVAELEIASGKRAAGNAFAFGYADSISELCSKLTLSQLEQQSIDKFLRDMGLRMHTKQNKIRVNGYHFDQGRQQALDANPLSNPVNGAAAARQIGR